MRHEDTPRKTKLIHGIGKLIVILASVPVFLFAIQSARGLVRVLSGIGSFVSLASIVVLGILELTWIIVVSERKLPAQLRHASSILVRELGVEAVALFVLMAIPVVILSVQSDMSVTALLTTFDSVTLIGSLAIAVGCFILARSLRRERRKESK